MSMSDSDSSSYVGDCKSFKLITRERLLHEMLRSTKTGDSKSTWKVLIMDKLTVKIMSHSCKMTDITDEGVSLVEDIYKRRQPLPSMDAIYFIQPTREKAFIFFSSSISRELVMDIKKDTKILSRLGALREMNLEYFPIDSQEFPSVRFRAAKSLDATTMTTFRDLIPTKLAAGVWDCLMKYKKSIPNFPQTETCDLLILDRSIDQIAPVIHEWTYDAMCHDLLNMDGNKYVHEVPGKSGGPPEKREVLLEDRDPIWLELRHAHIADASERLHEKMTNFVSKNKAAQIVGSKGGGDMSTRDIQKMVQALPQYSEQIDKLSLHIEEKLYRTLLVPDFELPDWNKLTFKHDSESDYDLGANFCIDINNGFFVQIAGKINRIIRESGLREIGQLEQDLVFGDATTKDVIKFFTTKEDITHENRLRLLMILASIYPEKFEGEKGLNLMRLAKLTEEDMSVVHNLRMLGGQPVAKKSMTSAFGLKFEIHKKKRAARKERPGEEEKWQLSRFYPIIEELIENLARNELSSEDYPCLNDPSPSYHGSPFSGPVNQNPHSMRSRRTPTWARPRGSEDGYSSDSVIRHASSDFRRVGQRIFVFIVGGATRSELRVCHKLTEKLKREIILGSSSIDDPAQFVTKLNMMTTHELSLDDIQI
ncbi:SNARE-interacting protein [Vigna angularis]|uniref:SNARE-interacting protein n=1 Tax=Phaseolus angularis TaxID=3914 RepID=A0A8T0JKS3_PHAAN|nr:SNARE-interacting protein [Vigna angularis]